jgi:hypothetical protein
MAQDFSKITSSDQLLQAVLAAEKSGDSDLRESLFRYGAGGNVAGLYSNGQEVTKENQYSVNQGGQQVAYNDAFEAPVSSAAPPLSGNMAVDQANILSNILNSPLYTEELKYNYLETYLPGLTRANFDINTAKAAELENDVMRRQYQKQAIRSVAGDYASRGMRTPEMVNRGFAPIQQDVEQDRTAAGRNITGLEGQKELLYGAGALDGETFMTDPTKFGSVGQLARQSAVKSLTQLPKQYGLDQVQNASTSPLQPKPELEEEKPVATSTPASGLSRAQLQAKIDAGRKYVANKSAMGQQKFVTGGNKKIQGYQSELDSLNGGY